MRTGFTWFSACCVFLFIGLYAGFLAWLDWDWEAVAMVRAMMGADGVIPVLSWMSAFPPEGWWLTWYPLAAVVSFGFFLWCLQNGLLDLIHGGVTDEGANCLAELQSLKTIDLRGTQITDAGLKELQSLHNLKELNLCLVPGGPFDVTREGLNELRAALPEAKILS